MKKKFYLPVIYPPITNFLAHACYLSIILNNDYYDWFYSNYINLCYSIDTKSDWNLDFFCGDQSWYITFLGFLKCQRIHNSILYENKFDTVSFFKTKISEGNYIITFVDEYFIPGKYAYKNVNYPHRILIHGFDDNIGSFITGTWGEDSYYTLDYKIKYENFNKALISSFNSNKLSFNSNSTVLIKSNEVSFDYYLDVEYVRSSLIEYITSEDISYKYGMFFNVGDRNGKNYGIKAYEKMQLYVEQTLYRKDFISVIPFLTMLQHKKCMIDRMLYMVNKGLLKDKYQLSLDIFSSIRMELSIMIQILHKYNLTKKLDAGKFIKKIEKMGKDDKAATEVFINSIY